MRHYSARWQTPKVVLIGYSFGAGVLPLAVNRLPAEDRARVAMVSLLGLEAKASFEIAITGWLGAEAEGPDVLPELLRISPDLVQCFYGEDEDDTLCRAPELARTEIIHTEGGHHFDGDYAGLAQRILDGAKRRLGAQ
jgi:type IV secretory pathway VirJ component